MTDRKTAPIIDDEEQLLRLMVRALVPKSLLRFVEAPVERSRTANPSASSVSGSLR